MYKNIFAHDEWKRSEHMAVRENVGWYLWTHQIMEVTGIDEFTVSESDILQGVVLATASR